MSPAPTSTAPVSSTTRKVPSLTSSRTFLTVLLADAEISAVTSAERWYSSTRYQTHGVLVTGELSTPRDPASATPTKAAGHHPTVRAAD